MDPQVRGQQSLSAKGQIVNISGFSAPEAKLRKLCTCLDNERENKFPQHFFIDKNQNIIMMMKYSSFGFVAVQPLSRVRLFVTP